MRPIGIAILLVQSLLVACLGGSDRRTLAGLRDIEPDLTEVRIEDGIDEAIGGYSRFLEEAPESTLTPEAMRRLADLKLEKQFGVTGGGDLRELPAPATAERASAGEADSRAVLALGSGSPGGERSVGSEQDLEARIAEEGAIAPSQESFDLELPGGGSMESAGPLEAIALYDQILETYPGYPHNDQVLYQKARAYDELGRNGEAIAVTERLVAEYPGSRHIDEVQFRRAEYFFTRKKYLDAENAYAAIVAMGSHSDYYELALYKLGWTLYKQMLLEESLEQYITLLDYKVSIGYDFDQTEDEADERRIADTYRVISLCFSDLGGAEAVESYFTTNGQRGYENRVYRHLGEFYLEKLRYNDAASIYKAFVSLYPFHRDSPHFGMRVVEIYAAGDFPILVLESKKEFAASYGLQSDYWRHFDVQESPEVLEYLKRNLGDLANHYHALYQSTEHLEDKPAYFEEGARWYRAYLASFPTDPDTPGIHYQLADLLLEHEEFGPAAGEYEHTAYRYPEHERAADAGYAAIFAHREHLKRVTAQQVESVRRAAVSSTIQFVDTFPGHEQAAPVLGAAVDDIYALEEFELAIETGRRLIEEYGEAEVAIRRSAWTVIAHSAFELTDFEQAEGAYTRVLEMTPEADGTRQDLVENLAAAIYKQGEEANLAEDFSSAADHFLRIARAAPGSEIRPLAEYDAGAALIRLEDWTGAAAVLDSFRTTYPDHELNREATKQVAFVYREEGNLARAAEEYERVARESEDPDLRREVLLLAGELYETAQLTDRALAVYHRYVSEFTNPIETAVVTRHKMAEIYQDMGDGASYRDQLRQIVAIDQTAGESRTGRVRSIAAQSALTLTEDLYRVFHEIELTQPFETSLAKKQLRMNEALDALGRLIDYEIGEVTAAATFYMAEVYREFSRALMESERPLDLAPAELMDYEMVLEEEAFPFEEKAIEVHEKNLELMAASVFNAWIEKSLAQLAVAMPGRYAKFEASSGLIDSLEAYVYRRPGREEPVESEVDALAKTSTETVDGGDGEAQPTQSVVLETTEPFETVKTVDMSEGEESAATPAEEQEPFEVEPVPAAPSQEMDPYEPMNPGENAQSEDQAAAGGDDAAVQ